MAQLYYCYGAMNSGKSLELLKVAHNYHEQGKHIILMTSATDTREPKGTIKSRIGISTKAEPIYKSTNITDLSLKFAKQHYSSGVSAISCILIDEAQFLRPIQVRQLAELVDAYHVPVMAFGLKNDFQNHLFPGSEAFLEYADKLKEIKTICWFCGRKATMNLRINNSRPVYSGNEIQVGGNDQYLSVCRYHYFHPDLHQLHQHLRDQHSKQ